MSHKKNKRRYLGTRSIEWMLGQIQNKSVSRGDICRFNDMDYVFNGKEWKLESWNLSKSNNVKSDNTNAVSEAIQRIESTFADIQKWGYEVNEAIGKLNRRSSDRGSVVVLCGLIVMFFLGILVGGFHI